MIALGKLLKHKESTVISARAQQAIENALQEIEASKYAELCNRYGITPTDQLFYEKGLADLLCEEEHDRQYELMSKAKPPKGAGRSQPKISVTSQRRYEEFLKEAKHIPLGSYDSNASAKRTLLEKYFRRFTRGGVQDLNRYNDTSAGSIFDRLVGRAEDVCARYRNQQ